MSDPPSLCYHCGEPIPNGARIMAQLAAPQPMCCEGCRAVAELIAGAGLQDYYRFRSQPGNQQNTAAAQADPLTRNDAWQSYADTQVAAAFVVSSAAGKEASVSVMIDGLRCAACTWLIDRHLRQLPGIVRVQLNPATARARISWNPELCSLDSVLRGIAGLGYQPQPLALDASDDLQQQAINERRVMLKRLGVAGLGMMQVMMYVLPLYVRDQTHMSSEVSQFLQLVSLLLTMPVLAYSGWPFLSSALRAIRNRSINMDVPVALALLLAFVASIINSWRGEGEVYYDSVTMFVFLLTLGRYIEMTVRHRTGSLTDALQRIQPRIAHRWQDGRWQDVPLAQLQEGDQILVRVGEAIPADARVTAGRSALDESLLTGEALPVRRSMGDDIWAGSINVDAPLHASVSATGAATALATIVRLVEQAQLDKPTAALLADRIARRFLQWILVLTMLVGVTWLMRDPHHPWRAFEAVLAVLVVTCPCALSLATPVAVAAATTALARQGLLITRANAIEQLAAVQSVFFDKTGTLTTGRMQLQQVEVTGRRDRDTCLAIAAALEQGAEHPVAAAIRHAALAVPALQAESVTVIPGAGVAGVVQGITYRLGKPSFASTESAQQDAVVLADDAGTLARFRFVDPVREDANATVLALTQAGLQVGMLSGDGQRTVQQVAEVCGITTAYARLSPSDKLDLLKAQRMHRVVAMVGDGINDAPVLSAASVSIAMGSGSALAQASADAVLLRGLSALPQALRVAHRAQRVMQQNLIWAAVYNIAAVPLAAAGLVTPWVAAAGMSLSSVLVVLNAARLMRVAPVVMPATSSRPALTRSLTQEAA